MADFATREELVNEIAQIGYQLHLQNQTIEEQTTRIQILEQQQQNYAEQLSTALSDQAKYGNLIDWIEQNGSDTIKEFIQTL